jgi:hypothetical protein
MDGIGNLCDNCINVANFNQLDSDSDGLGDLCDMTLDRVVVKLNWNTLLVDFDLHAVNPYGTFFGNNDCRAGNVPNWCNSGIARDARGQSTTDLQEVLVLTNPDAGLYTLGVDLYTINVNTSATVEIYCLGSPVMTFNSGAISSNSLANRTFWEVATINPTTCEITPIQQNRQALCNGNNFNTCVCNNCTQGICSTCDLQCEPTTGACVDACIGVQCGVNQRCDSRTGNCMDVQCMQCTDRNDPICQPEGFCVSYNNGNNFGCGVYCTPSPNPILNPQGSCNVGETCRQFSRNNQNVYLCADNTACQ